MTPAHTDDVHAAMIEGSDLEVITEASGERRKRSTIGPRRYISHKTTTEFVSDVSFRRSSAQKIGCCHCSNARAHRGMKSRSS